MANLIYADMTHFNSEMGFFLIINPPPLLLGETVTRTLYAHNNLSLTKKFQLETEIEKNKLENYKSAKEIAETQTWPKSEFPPT